MVNLMSPGQNRASSMSRWHASWIWVSCSSTSHIYIFIWENIFNCVPKSHFLVHNQKNVPIYIFIWENIFNCVPKSDFLEEKVEVGAQWAPSRENSTVLQSCSAVWRQPFCQFSGIVENQAKRPSTTISILSYSLRDGISIFFETLNHSSPSVVVGLL